MTYFVVSPAFSSDNDLRELSFYTESYPPANYLVDNKITGYSVDILLAASALVGEPVTLSQITLQPWARSYRTVLTHGDSVLFSTTRSNHREELFNWVGPIVDIKVVVLARRDANVKIDDPLDMANYRIGVIRDDIGEQSLLSLGVPRDSMQEASYVTVLAEQLMKKRIDLLVYSERAAYWWARQAGIDPDLFEAVYVVQEGQVYFAFNRETDKSVVEKLQRGLDMLKKKDESGNSRYDEILEKY
ncbi:substrate-binding periplasmic protein [Vibrio ouci]|uniref:Transporter substrate-binding domain-containing protein n=1 Tax=Vibrio ouci TaxID=2499078 RepID=A0A4Y8WKK4_9VIBR|nr:transporter substrate-binding domain-containing protein [Vibrio ouci]TFH93374.1 transporter substrate-binding domain-containing protein [Vibrio ouci]